ncbi:DsbA family protein [Maricaulis sp.]|uniref:2-hydroxychromene-2-carboxylate isomerase n=1 Tax=Maricaulis sp. TaxID=1486257 RepID=UPI0025BC8FEB|nr:DsbA family protein [Maricaulis sp.]
MSPKSLTPLILTSPTLRATSRLRHAALRNLTGRPRTLHAFIERNEPYSNLLLQALPRIAERHGVKLVWHEVGPPERSAAPEPDKLAAWSAQDAGYLAQAYNLKTESQAWPDTMGLEAGNALRNRLGHYGSAMTWFEGEWYWGIDRLHHLECRLGGQPLLFPPIAEPDHANGGQVDVFLSLRSPYSYLAAMRLFDLAKHWQADIRLRPVLPMVMRALPVPTNKRVYIVRDCKREAERLGLPFGNIVDPVGVGVERGLAVLVGEINRGRGREFLQAFMTGVWSQGIDPAHDAGLRRICDTAGVRWDQALSDLDDESWRLVVEANRAELFENGHWGVPTFKVGDRMAFGQDRLWLVGQWLGLESS